MESAGKLQKIAGRIFTGIIVCGLLLLSYREAKTLKDFLAETLLLSILSAPYILVSKYIKDIHFEILIFSLSIIAYDVLSNYLIFHKPHSDTGIASAAGFALVRLFSQKKPFTKMAIIKTIGIILLFILLFGVDYTVSLHL